MDFALFILGSIGLMLFGAASLAYAIEKTLHPGNGPSLLGGNAPAVFITTPIIMAYSPVAVDSALSRRGRGILDNYFYHLSEPAQIIASLLYFLCCCLAAWCFWKLYRKKTIAKEVKQ